MHLKQDTMINYVVLNAIYVVQYLTLFGTAYCSTINDFPKTYKMSESSLNTKEIFPEELEGKALNEI